MMMHFMSRKAKIIGICAAVAVIIAGVVVALTMRQGSREISPEQALRWEPDIMITEDETRLMQSLLAHEDVAAAMWGGETVDLDISVLERHMDGILDADTEPLELLAGDGSVVAGYISDGKRMILIIYREGQLSKSVRSYDGDDQTVYFNEGNEAFTRYKF